MNASVAERFLLDQIPLPVQRKIPPKLRLAYAGVDQLIAGNPMLQVPTALDNRGRLISWAVDYSIKGLIESGEWPVDFRWQSFANPTGCYLEIRLPHSTMSISQVNFWKDQPRNVVFRENARFSNAQRDFFNSEQSDEFDPDSTGPVSFLLVHGYKDLQFAHIGIPHKTHQHGYVYQTKNLLNLLYEVPSLDVPPPEEAIDIEDLLTMKAEIEKWRRDNGDT